MTYGTFDTFSHITVVHIWNSSCTNMVLLYKTVRRMLKLTVYQNVCFQLRCIGCYIFKMSSWLMGHFLDTQIKLFCLSCHNYLSFMTKFLYFGLKINQWMGLLTVLELALIHFICFSNFVQSCVTYGTSECDWWDTISFHSIYISPSWLFKSLD